METTKKFDAVKMMREIREQLSERYWNHPEILKADMEAIRKEYNLDLPEIKLDQDSSPSRENSKASLK